MPGMGCHGLGRPAVHARQPLGGRRTGPRHRPGQPRLQPVRRRAARRLRSAERSEHGRQPYARDSQPARPVRHAAGADECRRRRQLQPRPREARHRRRIRLGQVDVRPGDPEAHSACFRAQTLVPVAMLFMVLQLLVATAAVVSHAGRALHAKVVPATVGPGHARLRPGRLPGAPVPVPPARRSVVLGVPRRVRRRVRRGRVVRRAPAGRRRVDHRPGRHRRAARRRRGARKLVAARQCLRVLARDRGPLHRLRQRELRVARGHRDPPRRPARAPVGASVGPVGGRRRPRGRDRRRRRAVLGRRRRRDAHDGPGLRPARRAVAGQADPRAHPARGVQCDGRRHRRGRPASTCFVPRARVRISRASSSRWIEKGCRHSPPWCSASST